MSLAYRPAYNMCCPSLLDAWKDLEPVILRGLESWMVVHTSQEHHSHDRKFIAIDEQLL